MPKKTNNYLHESLSLTVDSSDSPMKGTTVLNITAKSLREYKDRLVTIIHNAIRLNDVEQLRFIIRTIDSNADLKEMIKLALHYESKGMAVAFDFPVELLHWIAETEILERDIIVTARIDMSALSFTDNAIVNIIGLNGVFSANLNKIKSVSNYIPNKILNKGNEI